MALDKLQLQQFIDNMVGFRTVGAAQDEELQVPVSPEMRNFVIARIGELTPSLGYYCLQRADQREALARLLREVSDSLFEFTP